VSRVGGNRGGGRKEKWLPVVVREGFSRLDRGSVESVEAQDLQQEESKSELLLPAKGLGGRREKGEKTFVLKYGY